MHNETQYKERIRVAQRLRELRMSKGMTQAELCKRLGFAHPSSISSIEKARRPLYRAELKAFAQALDCEVDDILGVSEQRSECYPLVRRARLVALAGTMAMSSVVFGCAVAENCGHFPLAGFLLGS